MQNSAPRWLRGRQNFSHSTFHWRDYQSNASICGRRFQNKKFEEQKREGCRFVDLGHRRLGKICLNWLCFLQGRQLLHSGVFNHWQKLLWKFRKVAIELPWKVKRRLEFIPLHGDWKQKWSCCWEVSFIGRGPKLGKIERIFLLWDICHCWNWRWKGIQGSGWAWVGPEWGRRRRHANKSWRGFRSHQNGSIRRFETHRGAEAKEEKVQMLNTPKHAYILSLSNLTKNKENSL